MFETNLFAFKTSKLAARLALASLVMGSAACGAVGPGGESDEADVGQSQEGISGGNLAANNNAPFNAVVKLPGCTGTKIGPRRFLTAGHCNGMINPARSTTGGAQVTIDNTLNGNSPTTIAVSRFYVHPSYGDPAGMGSDAAVLDVSQDTPSISTMAVDNLTVPQPSGVTILGYGCDDRNPSNGGKKQWANLTTLTFAEITALAGSGTAVHDPLYLYYNGGPVDGNYVQLCPGDSGGPVVRFFSTSTGSSWRVSGIDVYRFNDSANTVKMSASTRTAPIAGWIGAPTLGAVHGTITNVLTGKCLSGGGATTSGSAVILDVCDPTTASSGTQFWSLVPTNIGGVVKNQIKNGKSGLCLDGGTTAGATNLTMTSCLVAARQRWSVTANAQTPGTIVQEQTGQNLGALGGATDIFSSEGNNRQRWLVAP
jgi:hypothetical protein